MKNNFIIEDGLVKISIRCKGETYTAILLEEDFPLIKQYTNTWTGHRNREGKIYVRMTYKGAVYALHEIILGKMEGMVIDHRNHNPLDNTRPNLRHVTKSVNKIHTTKSTSRTGFKNVRSVKYGKFNAVITEQGLTRSKSFSTLTEAVMHATFWRNQATVDFINRKAIKIE